MPRGINKDNLLEKTYPHLVEEWDYEKNEIDISKITYGSNKKVWWKCSRGHSFEQQVSNRTIQGSSCRFCCGNQTSFQEQAILFYLEKKYNTVKSRHIIAEQEIDIFIEDINTAIEYDGFYYHKNKYDADINKNIILDSNNINIVRIREKGLREIPLCEIIEHDGTHKHLNSIIKNISNLDDIDIERDMFAIKERYNQIEYLDSISCTHPSIASEWNYKKNESLQPHHFKSGSSSTKVWWKCSDNHEWQEYIYNRTKLNLGCPYCSGHRVTKENSLGFNYKEISQEWNYEKNEGTPFDYTKRSNKTVWWKCKNNHEWQTSINARVNGNSCGFCAGKFAHEKRNLETDRPEIAKLWNYEKNKLKPIDVMPMARKKVWWKCENGHEYEAYINNKTTICKTCRRQGL